ncbi:A disintegrin and metalloproteinase with thrombospondin motifs 16-like [Mercenaria mercenaria]|uniref:A disintegrin and metalloproteinase with thrombospondin motifs 16-like n=1 Tax=Mercenaria mercenaria TaxID=6596 RepID=UPI001E1DC7F9|nr:A disintegrin and metalloproteinase with thrombospondin motifs 16-like [Mercenaria mercenaria]
MAMLIVNILLLCAIQWTQADKELVTLEDLNDNYDRRSFRIRLPDYLRITILRENADNVELYLHENKRLNANAPVYDAGEENGVPTAKEFTKVLPFIETAFYHDMASRAALKISCSNLPYSECQWVLEGILDIDGVGYQIAPVLPSNSRRGIASGDKVKHFLEKVAPGEVTQTNITVEDIAGSSEHDHKDIPGVPDTEGLPEYDYTLLPEEPNVFEGGENNLRALLQDEDIEKTIKKMFAKEYRHKRESGKQYAVEVAAVVDSSAFQKYSRLHGGDFMKTLHFMRSRLATILNGVSQRYEEIDDPDMDVYVTISKYVIYEHRGTVGPLPGTVKTYKTDRYEFVDSDVYIDVLPDWLKTMPILKHDDHVMVFTGYELYYGGNVGNHVIEGVAYNRGACGELRVSLLEDDGSYYGQTTLAAHELGHNLGAEHDGMGVTARCHPNYYIMAPSMPAYFSGNSYPVNLGRFSSCSVSAFKYFFGRGGRCFTNLAKDKTNYISPEEPQSPEQQCKSAVGNYSSLCSDPDDEDICRVMKCQGKWECSYHVPAKGTRCNPYMWCIGGRCVVRPDAPADACINRGTDYLSCKELSDVLFKKFDYVPAVWCQDPRLKKACCHTCKDYPCADGGYFSWSCRLLSQAMYNIFKHEPSQWCKRLIYRGSCCQFCKKHGV